MLEDAAAETLEEMILLVQKSQRHLRTSTVRRDSISE